MNINQINTNNPIEVRAWMLDKVLTSSELMDTEDVRITVDLLVDYVMNGLPPGLAKKKDSQL